MQKIPKSADSSSKDQDAFNRQLRRQEVLSLNAYQRHLKYIHDYQRYYGGKNKESSAAAYPHGHQTEWDIIKKHHKFVWDAQESVESDAQLEWERRLAKRYHDKLFKEYCLAELKFYKENKIAMRWRTEKEVADGKGQFTCGSLRCDEKEELKSWEVNFGYSEDGERKNALVKLRLCPRCSDKLHYKKRKEERRQQKREEKRREKYREDEHDEDDVKYRHSRRRRSRSPSIRADTAHSEREKKREKYEEEDRGGEKSTQDRLTSTTEPEASDASSIWKQPAESVAPQRTLTKEEEFDQFFADLFQ